MVDEQVQGQIQQLISQFGGDEKVFEQMLAAQDITREKFEEDAREAAEGSVRTQLFLDALADVEQPEVSQEELMDHIGFTAAQYGMDPNQFIMQLQQAGQIGSLFADVRRGKALAINIAKSSVKDSEGNEIDPKQFFGTEEESEKAEEAKKDEKPKKAAKKSSAKKTTKKSTAKKSTAKKTTKKSTAKKSTAKKTTKKAAAKKTTKKAAAKKSDDK